MSRSEMDLQAIREKLLKQTQQYGASAVDAAPVDWSQARSSHGPAAAAPIYPSTPPNTQQFVKTIETLKQRASQPLNPPQPPKPTGWMLEAVAQVNIHQQRLEAIVDQINDLSARQEQVMLAMKAVADRLDLEQRRQQRFEAEQGLPVTPPIEINYSGAIVASAEQDDLGNVVLTYRSIDLHRSDREASHLAQSLRDRSRGQTRRTPRLTHQPGLQTLLAEPLSVLQGLWNTLSEIALEGLDRISSSVQEARSQSAPFTLTDGIIWFGGGVISRLALNLLLSAYPGLWSLAVAVVTGMTAYALYRATLAPRLEFGLAYRVLLAVAGLIVGGRF